MTITETVADRIARLSLDAISPSRLETLTQAHPLVADATFRLLASAMRVARKASIVLPAHRYESLSRGRGWARQGRGDSAIWGDREDKGYRVTTTGRWVVGASDGFSRKDETTWDVTRVVVGAETWTIAN